MVEDENFVLAALKGAGDVAYCWDLVKDSIEWAGDAVGLFGASEGILSTGDGFTDRLHAEDMKTRRSALSHHIADGESFDCEYRIRAKKGDFKWIHECGQVERSDSGEPVRLTGTLREITARKRREVLLEQRASYDELTGHFNKSRLRDALEHAIAYSDRYDIGGAFLVVGIDKMAMINEAYGHDDADTVIVGASQRLEDTLRSTDVIGRIGGDRFGIVLGNIDEAGLATAAEKILDCFRSDPIDSAAGPIQISVTVGGILFPGLIQTAHDIMACAENAMQEGKTQGRNCFLPYQMSEEQRSRQREFMALGESVVKALREKRVVFAYQPVVECQTGAVSYYETLIRMLDDSGEVVPAYAFVPIIERLGLIRQMDRRTLDMAISDLTADSEIELALNISSLTATDRTWLRALVGYVKNKPELARRLMIEITETAALQDFEDSARFVAAVRNLGCQVALDDFGSGYTSFRHLKSMTVDVVKIDGSFVKKLAENPDNQLFIKTLLNLADGFGLKTVAECVETAEDAQILKEQGVSYLQGWYYGKPAIGRPGDPNQVIEIAKQGDASAE
ncbi:MAG TPA: hypothetical protein DCS82_09630 [Rhodospirillaceae bacterium]|nr:hypothetical protein [Rhodospirillaceae bacterium]HAT35965.1 hypothetical protein [Rhodospirillaceae bacterium]